MADLQLTVDQKRRLCEALLKIRALHDLNKRDLYVSELETQLGHPLNVTRHSEARYDLWSVVSACQARPGALRAFVYIIRGFHGEIPTIVELEQLVEEAERPALLADSQLEALTHMLAGLEEHHLASAYLGVVEPTGPEPPPDWRQPALIVRQVERVTMPEESAPLLFLFVDFLAHTVDGRTGAELHRWIDVAAAELAISEPDVRLICRDTTRRLNAEQAGESTFTELPPSNPGAPVINASMLTPAVLSQQPENLRIIWGSVPIRNPDFTGRAPLLKILDDTLAQRSKASVLPQTLHGLGGVGKTQLAVEYVYRYAERYDLVWWISAEQPSQVRASLATLGERLGLPPSQDMQQTAITVLDALGTSRLRWLLVYDNADLPEDITPLLPSAGGHVIVTSRNQAWAASGESIEVDVFERPESIELLQKRGEGISREDADQLAQKLGDLPLALEQAAGWHAATGMPVSEYLQLFDEHVQELLDEGRPASYPMTVYAFLRVAVDRLRSESPAAAQLLELFAFLGAEPMSATLLRSGRDAAISEPLAKALHEPIAMNRAIRELRRYALAKVDPNGQRIQVHRLVQLVLREGLREDRREQSQANVTKLLASANPGDPDEPRNWPVHAELGPHIVPANLINADSADARLVVLDQLRYLFRVGDYEGCRSLGEMTVRVWSTADGVGPDHEMTLIANRHLGDALRGLGETARARELDLDTLERLRRNPLFGESHEHTLYMANSVGADLRIAGDFQRAKEVDEENLARHLRVYGDEDQHALRTKGNLAVSLRLLGDFRASFELNSAIISQRRRTLGDNDFHTLFSVANLAWDLHGLGRYSEALEAQQRAFPLLRDLLGPGHNHVLLAARLIAVALRKTGRYQEALSLTRENYLSYHARFGELHEYTLAATMSHANTLRTVGQLTEARSLATGALETYGQVFGAQHPFTLAAATNVAIILRALGERRDARELDETTLTVITEVLGEEHPYTLCVANNFANDLVLDHELTKAREWSQRTLVTSRRVRGVDHPYTLACAANAASDLLATGDPSGQELLDRTIAQLRRTLGIEHPETLDAGRGKRAECDIEPPPT